MANTPNKRKPIKKAVQTVDEATNTIVWVPTEEDSKDFFEDDLGNTGGPNGE